MCVVCARVVHQWRALCGSVCQPADISFISCAVCTAFFAAPPCLAGKKSCQLHSGPVGSHSHAAFRLRLSNVWRVDLAAAAGMWLKARARVTVL
jgi:hypothetical protein